MSAPTQAARPAGALNRPAPPQDPTRAAARPGRRWCLTLGLAAALSGLLTACGSDSSGGFFPLQPGRQLVYHIHTETMRFPTEIKLTVRELEPGLWQDEPVERRLVNNRLLQFYRRDAEGVFRVATSTLDAPDATPDEPPEPVLRYPLELDRSWEQVTTTGVLDVVVDPFRLQVFIREPVQMRYTVAALDDVVSVPAGRFENCLRIDGYGTGRYPGMSAILPADITVEQSDWYAPGVGLVKSLRTERTSSIVVPRGSFRLELERLERDGAALLP